MPIDDSWYARPEGVRDRTSAGGVVARLEGGHIRIALVREGDFGDLILPKGGIKKGETLEETARREIEEEAGLTDLTLLAELGSRQRLSFDRRHWITTHYFLYRTEQRDGTPTDPKHVYHVSWCPIDELSPIFWPEQRELIETNRDEIVRLVRDGGFAALERPSPSA